MNFDPNTPQRYCGCIFMRTKGNKKGRYYLLISVYVHVKLFALIDLSTGKPWIIAADPFFYFQDSSLRLMPVGTTALITTNNTGEFELVDEDVVVVEPPHMENPVGDFLGDIGFLKAEPPVKNEQEII